MVSGTLVALLLASAHPSFPIWQEKGQPTPPDDQPSYVVKAPLHQLEHFYRAEFKGDADISFLKGEDDHGERLTILNASKHDGWTKAVIAGSDLSSTIRVVRVMQIDPGAPITATPPHPVEFITPRSSVVEQQLRQIDAEHQPVH